MPSRRLLAVPRPIRIALLALLSLAVVAPADAQEQTATPPVGAIDPATVMARLDAADRAGDLAALESICLELMIATSLPAGGTTDVLDRGWTAYQAAYAAFRLDENGQRMLQSMPCVDVAAGHLGIAEAHGVDPGEIAALRLLVIEQRIERSRATGELGPSLLAARDAVADQCRTRIGDRPRARLALARVRAAEAFDDGLANDLLEAARTTAWAFPTAGAETPALERPLWGAAEAWLLLARSQLAAGRIDAAEASIERALERRPGFGAAARWQRRIDRAVAAAPPAAGRVRSVDGTMIAFDVAGRGDSAVVLVHGWCCDSTYWTRQIAPLVTSGRRVVRVDLGGHGRSDRRTGRVPMSLLGADVAAVVRLLDAEDVVLVGHSMGGHVIIEAARRLPGSVRGLIGIDTLQDPSAHDFPDEIIAGFVGPFEEDFGAAMEAFVRDSGSFFRPDTSPRIVTRITEAMAAADPVTARAALVGLLEHDVEAALRSVDLPLICLNAGILPTNVEVLESLVPDFELVELAPSATHFPMIEQPPAAFDVPLVDAVDRIGR